MLPRLCFAASLCATVLLCGYVAELATRPAATYLCARVAPNTALAVTALALIGTVLALVARKKRVLPRFAGAFAVIDGTLFLVCVAGILTGRFGPPSIP